MKHFLIAALLLACSTSFAFERSDSEPLLGFLPTKTGVIFQVRSGGCTRREDLAFTVSRHEGGSVTLLTLIRHQPDLCHPFLPMGERFKFTYEELGLRSGEKFKLANPNGVVEGWIFPE